MKNKNETTQQHHGSGDNIEGDKHVHEQHKNTVNGSTINAGRDVHIGDNNTHHHHSKKTYPKYLSPNFPKFNIDKFVGRKDMLERLHQDLEAHKKTLVLNGLGGMGKTSVAQMYCHLHKKDYDHLVWINQLDSFENACLNAFGLQKNLGISLLDTPEQSIRLLFYSLNQIAGNNLLVLDNADTGLQAYTDDLPPTWKILVTSRQTMDERFTAHHLDRLDFAEAQKLFAQYFKKATFREAELRALCEKIGYHTLTLELLAKTLEESLELQSITELTQYLENHRLNAEALQEEVFTHHSKSEVEIYAYLLQAFTLAALSEEEKWVLLQFAVLPPLAHQAKDFFKWIQVEHPKPYQKLLKQLHKKGWLERKVNAFSMHRLVGSLVRYQVVPTYENCQGLVDSFENLLYFDQNKDNPVDKFQWVEYGMSLCDNVQDNQEQIGSLNYRTAWIFQELGNYTKAVEYYKKAIVIAEILENVNDINAYNNNLANVYRNLGRYEEAAKLLEAALKSDLEHFGEKHPSVAIRQSNLAIVYRKLGRYEEAAKLLEAALKSAIEQFGDKHPNVATRQSNLGNVYRNLGRYEEAAKLLEAALKSAIEQFGDKHPNVATSQSNLANVYGDLGRYEESAKLLEAALKFEIDHFGDKHPNVATCQSNLALVYGDLGRYEESAKLLESALKSDLEHFGDKHPSVATRQSNLALVYGHLGRYEESAKLFEAALISVINHFGDKHPNVATCQSNLALVYDDLGRYDEAAKLLESALKSDLEHFGDKHTSVATRQSNLALVYGNLGRYEESAKLLESALKSAIDHFGDKHPQVATIQSNLANVYNNLGRYEESAKLLEAALKSDLDHFGDKHPSVAIRLNNLAWVYFDTKEYGKAKTAWLENYRILKLNFGEHPYLEMTEKNLQMVEEKLKLQEE